MNESSVIKDLNCDEFKSNMQVHILESVTKPAKFRENIEYAYEKRIHKRDVHLRNAKYFA